MIRFCTMEFGTFLSHNGKTRIKLKSKSHPGTVVCSCVQACACVRYLQR